MPKITDSILVTGGSSGLGRFLIETLNGIPYIRGKKNSSADIIIHSAWDNKFDKADYNYIPNSLSLINEVAKRNHRHFIFVSTTDIYQNSMATKESDEIDPRNIVGINAMSKFFAEQWIKENIRNYTIIRCSTLLGKYSNNAVSRLDKGNKITLSGTSVLNLVLYEQVFNFIVNCVADKIFGLYNLSSFSGVRLKDLYGESPLYGNFTYDSKWVDCNKAASIYPNILDTSLNNFKNWKK